MPVTMPVLFAYASMAVHLMLISMGILILLSRKPSDLFQFVPFRFLFNLYVSMFFFPFFSSVFLFFIFIFFKYKFQFSIPCDEDIPHET